MMTVSEEHFLNNVIYPGDLSCLVDGSLSYNVRDLNSALVLAIKKVCSQKFKIVHADDQKLIESTIPCLVEFALRRNCLR